MFGTAILGNVLCQGLPPSEVLVAESTCRQTIKCMFYAAEDDRLGVDMVMCSASMHFKGCLCGKKTLAEGAGPLMTLIQVRVRLRNVLVQPAV